MKNPMQFALDAAKDITIAAVSSDTNVGAWQCGDLVAEFFDAVYKKVLEIAKEVNDAEG